MNKLVLVILTIVATTISSCQLDIEHGTPGCIQAKIKDFSDKGIQCETGKSVNKYSFQGMTVYVFEPGICGSDMAADVFDSNCNNLGFLGGIAGNTEINEEDFSNAVFIETVWNN
jgi:hypothetical protein